MNVLELIDNKKVLEWRRHMHKYPEIAFKEKETCGYIAKEIEANFPEIKVLHWDDKIVKEGELPNYGLVAVLEGGKPGRAVAMRADFDALPMKEETDLEFKSVYENIAHTCGHDCHAAMLLGAMDALYKIRQDIEGTVLFVFQHAEECLPGGAQAIVDTGVFKDYDIKAFYGSHVFPSSPVGTIKFAPGNVTANTDSFDIEIQGKGGHGSTPEKCVDSLLIGTEVVQALNFIVPRYISAFDKAVITVGKFHAGTVANIIPDKAYISTTVRSMSPEVRDLIEQKVHEIATNICAGYGATCKINYTRGYTSVVNDEELCKSFSEIVDSTMPDIKVVASEPLMGGEDFSAYQQIAPTLFVALGCMPEGSECYLNHHPKFLVNEDVLPIGTALYVEFALKA